MFGINNELDQLYKEDFIWFIYFFIIGFNLYSNYLEEQYIKNKDISLKKKFTNINKVVFTIVLLIYIYFLIVSYNRLNSLKKLSKQKELAFLSFISSIFFVLAGIITLYITFQSDNIDEEIGIN